MKHKNKKLLVWVLLPLALFGLLKEYASWRPRILGRQQCCRVNSLAFSPDSSLLASAGGCSDEKGSDAVHLWDVRTRKSIGPLLDLQKHNCNEVYSLCFTVDGKGLYVVPPQACGNAEREKCELYLWDVPTRKYIRRLKGSQVPSNLWPAFSSDGEKWIFSPDNTLSASADQNLIFLQRAK